MQNLAKIRMSYPMREEKPERLGRFFPKEGLVLHGHEGAGGPCLATREVIPNSVGKVERFDEREQRRWWQ